MSGTTLQRQLSRKGSDKEKLANKVIRNPDLLPEIVDGLGSDEAAIKYGAAKILRIVADREPALLYPRMDYFAKLLDSDNNIMRWEAIHVIANLTRVDDKKKFERIFEGKAIDSLDRFFDQIKDKEPVVALVRRQLRSPRNATRKRAERFLKKRGLAPGENGMGEG